jgi:hypothetical protein
VYFPLSRPSGTLSLKGRGKEASENIPSPREGEGGAERVG